MEEQQQNQSQQVLKLLQQKIGNLELTVHALMNVLEQEGFMDQERINEEAEEIVEEMQEIEEEQVQKEVEKRVREIDTDNENRDS